MASLVFFALGLMSKAMLVTLPCALLLLDVWPLRRLQKLEFRSQKLKQLVVEKIPFLTLTVLFCVVTFLAQRASNATPSLQDLPVGLRLENVIVSYWRYLGWMLWPVNLAPFYPFPYDNHFYLALWPIWQIVAGLLLLVVVSVLCVKQISTRSYLAVGWFWYLGTMVPVIGWVQIGSQGMADRYTYIPLIGPVVSMVWLLAEKWGAGKISRWLLASATALVLAASVLQTRHQLGFWKNTEVLFQHTIEVTGLNPRAEYILGLGLEHEGRIAEATMHYRNAVATQPKIKDAFPALGQMLEQQGHWAEAEQVYATALADDPDNFAVHLGLATTLTHLGRLADAKAHLMVALRNCPDSAEAKNNLAWTLSTSPESELRDGKQAVELAKRACELTGYRETIMVGTLGAAYAEAGQFDEAVATAQKTCALATEHGELGLLNINQQLLELYRQHQPYRDNPGPAQP